jgi:hypothetical protein
MQECNCEEWKNSMPQITAAQTFCALQAAGPKYTGEPFQFCPWCGQRLITPVAGDGAERFPLEDSPFQTGLRRGREIADKCPAPELNR